jgi:peptidoglycan LD-endopeptidase CwlK
MLNAHSLSLLAEVHPALAARVKGLADALNAAGVFIQVTAGLRSPEQQDALYALGRTAPGKIVTQAQGFQSNHVIGCAVDVVAEDVTGLADWNPTHPSWAKIVELAPRYGLRDGKAWNDLPHLELVEVPPEPTGEIQELCKAEGIQAAWEELSIPA